MSWQGMNNLERLQLTKIRERIREIENRFIWTDVTPVTDVAAAECSAHVSVADARKRRYKPVQDGFLWGQPWGTCWFRLRFRIPAQFHNEAVTLRFVTGGECLIFRDGQPVQALDRGRTQHILTGKVRGGEAIELYVEAGANGFVGEFARRTMRQPEISIFNREVWEAYWDLAALADMVTLDDPKPWPSVTRWWAMEPEDTRRARIVYALNKAVDLFDYDEPSRAALREQARAVRLALKSVYACKATTSAQTVACMGHAHIDVAWLWPLAETVRKCGRTFSNVLDLMDRYPEFIFVQSQPHLYEFTKQRYPAIYERIRRKVKEGQWIPTGGMWVEADCNLISGESFVRQILFGTRFFRKEFGFEVKDIWLPDVFGYSAALPQIIQRSGLSYFLTQKISWSQFARFPHHSFWWEGIDGTRVLTHFPPADTYVGTLTATELLMAERLNRQKDRSSIQALPFGFGDGGGGPTSAMLERMRRYRDLEGMPKTVPMNVKDFFAKLEKESGDLPAWIGELYLEFHRGTYTTQAANKKNNRLAELGLRDAELLSAIAMTEGGRYPQDRLHDAWKTTLLNQFHDILPGSSIDEVYVDSDRHYAEILDSAREVQADAAGTLARKVDTRGNGTPVVAMNTLGWERRGVVAVAGLKPAKKQPLVASAGEADETPVQVGHDGLARFLGAIPSVGHQVFHVRPGRGDAPAVEATTRHLENDVLRVEFDEQGGLTRVFDKRAGREALEPGAVGNRLVVFEDKMVTCGPAWDMEIFYNDKPLEWDGTLLSAKVVEQGPVRSVIRFERRISKSILRQNIVLTAGSAQVDFETEIDWNEKEKDVILKVAFPVNVHADKARYEIQFGNVERPTHWNRPSDFGMFEVPAQKWVDLSEGDYGVALLNDCKYGHDTHGNVMRLTLLRAPKSPGKTADVGKTHTLTYSLLPHSGNYVNGVVRAAHELNVPVLAQVAAAHAGQVPAALSRLSVSTPNVVIDTVKKAEDDQAIIVRLYEAHGTRGSCEFRTTLPVKKLLETDLMEQNPRPVAFRGGKASLNVSPFQIVTLKLVL